jgi:hypothetical protein
VELRAAVDRIWENVDKRGAEECWLLVWADGRKRQDDRGRPRLKVGGRYVKTYRLVYAAARGLSVEAAETVEHTCGNVNCHNLEHLEEMSDADNTAARWARERAAGRGGAEPGPDDDGLGGG